MTQRSEKWNYHVLSRTGFWMVWRCHGIPCAIFTICLEPKGYLVVSDFRHCYDNFFKVPFWKVLLDNCETHWQQHFEDTLQLKVLRTWIKVRANSFIKAWGNIMEWKSTKVSLKLSLAKKYNPALQRTLHQNNDISLIVIAFFFSQTNLAFKSNSAFIDILDSFCYSLFTFLPFDHWCSTSLEVHPVHLQLFYKD